MLLTDGLCVFVRSGAFTTASTSRATVSPIYFLSFARASATDLDLALVLEEGHTVNDLVKSILQAWEDKV